MREKKGVQPPQVCNLLFFPLRGDQGIGCFFPLLSPLLLSSLFLCLAVYGEQAKGAPYWDR